MEVIKKKISLNDFISREEGPDYGKVSGNIYLKIQFNQTYDDMGVFSDMEFIPAPILNRDLTDIEKMLRPKGARVDRWYENAGAVTGLTENRLNELKSYSASNPYQVNFNIEAEDYVNYKSEFINGVTRITSLNPSLSAYTFDAKFNSSIGTPAQNTGLLYANTINPETGQVQTVVKYVGEGWNQTNSSLSAIIKEEYLLGIINVPEVNSDLFIDRGVTTVMESHLKLSEIKSLAHLEKYGNGYYKIRRN